MSQTDSTRELTLRDTIEAWKTHQGQDELLEIINDICNEVVSAVREGSTTERGQLATDLAVLRKVGTLPFPGTDSFLHVLQLMLRDQLGMTPRAARLRAQLPEAYAGALATIERLIAGETVEVEPEETGVEEGTSGETVEHPDPMHVLEQVLPIFEQGKMMLHDPQFGSRGTAAQYVDSIAQQATKDEVAGSPWFDAAAALSALAALLRGETPNVDSLTPTYRKLVEEARG
jgi:hypothetical protein